MDLRPTPQFNSSGRLSIKPAADDGLIPRTLEFIRSQLPAWRDDPGRPQDPSEPRLNSSLCDFLDNRSRSGCPMVRFKHEAPQYCDRTVDMGVHGMEKDTFVGTYGYTIYEPFMVIEAKRLPAPSKDREREYVTGTNKATGGIQRFKLGLHGAKVAVAVLVGYVEAGSIRRWHITINEWINDLAGGTSTDGCVWSQSDTLEQLFCDDEQGTSTAKSIHQRSDGCLTDAIKIHHFWVVMAAGLQ